MSVLAAIEGVSAASGLVKTLRDTKSTLQQSELNLKLAEITDALADAKMALADAKTELLDRENKINELTKSLDFRGNTVEVGTLTFDAKDGRPMGLPYCPRCRMNNGALLRMTFLSDRFSGRGAYYCSGCRSYLDASVTTPDFVPQT